MLTLTDIERQTIANMTPGMNSYSLRIGKVKVSDVEYTESRLVILTNADRQNIVDLAPGCNKIASFPATWTSARMMRAWMEGKDQRARTRKRRPAQARRGTNKTDADKGTAR